MHKLGWRSNYSICWNTGIWTNNKGCPIKWRSHETAPNNLVYKTFESQHYKNNKMTYAPSEDSDQPGHPPSLISPAVRTKKPLVLSYPVSASVNYDQSGRMQGTQIILLVLLCGSSFYVEKIITYNYNFSLSNGSNTCLCNHTGDIIHVFTHDGRGIRTRTDAAMSFPTALPRLYMGFELVWMRWHRLALRCTSSLPTALPRLLVAQ